MTKPPRACARACVCLFVCTHASASARTVLIHALACIVQLVTFDPRGAPAPALVGTWRADAQGSQWCAAAAAADTAGLTPSQSSSSHGESSLGFLQCSVGDAHLDRRVSPGQLRVEALFRRTSRCPPAPTEEIIAPAEDTLAIIFLSSFRSDRMAGAKCLLKTPR